MQRPVAMSNGSAEPGQTANIDPRCRKESLLWQQDKTDVDIFTYSLNWWILVLYEVL
jgi:hypothetical protein